MLQDPSQIWQTLTVNWYGGEQKVLEDLSFICLWYHAGETPLERRIVLVKTPGGKNEAEVLFSTNTSHSAFEIINWFVLRWNREVTFFEVRAHLGVETQRQWSDNAIQRSTPLLMAMYSLLTLIALKMNEVKKLAAHEITAWYNKQGELTFADIIVLIRRSIWSGRYFSRSAYQDDFVKRTEQDLDDLIYPVSLAA